MELEADPPLGEALLAALGPLVLGASPGPSATHAGYGSAWRRAAARESVENEPAKRRYALSPRSTRGAARA